MNLFNFQLSAKLAQKYTNSLLFSVTSQPVKVNFSIDLPTYRFVDILRHLPEEFTLRTKHSQTTRIQDLHFYSPRSDQLRSRRRHSQTFSSNHKEFTSAKVTNSCFDLRFILK